MAFHYVEMSQYCKESAVTFFTTTINRNKLDFKANYLRMPKLV